MRVKSRTRVLLQEAGCEANEWPLAAKLAAHAMRNHARRKLGMKASPSLPYNSKVQILQRSWNRGVWESVTTTARTKGPSNDSSRGWIVKTADGRLLTTGTMFPAPREDQKLEFSCPGEPVVVSEPERRIRGKTTLKAFSGDHNLQRPKEPSEVEQRAWDSIAFDSVSQEAVVEIVEMAANQLPVSSRNGSVGRDVSQSKTGAWCGNLGGYSCNGAIGITNLSSSHAGVSRLITSWAVTLTTAPFAAVEVRCNLPLPLSRDTLSLSGTSQVVIPVQAGSMQVWCQGQGSVSKEVRPGVLVKGGYVSVQEGQPLEFLPQQWKQIDVGNQPCVYLVCYTPKGLHKLSREQKQQLLSMGFSCLPSGQGEFWSVQSQKGLLRRHHPNPRRGMFNPATCKDLPVPLEALGNLRHVTQQMADGTVHTSMQWWRGRAHGKGSGKWTGTTVFQLHCAARDITSGGGTISISTHTGTGNDSVQPGVQAQGAPANNFRSPGVQAQGADDASSSGVQAQGVPANNFHSPGVQAQGADDAKTSTAQAFRLKVQMMPAAQASRLKVSPQITSTAQAFRLKVQMMPAAQASRLKVSPQITSTAQASRLKVHMMPAAQASRLKVSPQISSGSRCR